MNIVKGVAGFIRRTSISHHGESTSGTHVQRFNPPMRNISFSNVSSDSILDSIWRKYEGTVDEAEKRRLFQIFLKKFLDVYVKWEPVDTTEELGTTAVSSSSLEDSSEIVNIVGCSSGHPTEVILALIEDIMRLTSLVTEMNNASSMQSEVPVILQEPTFVITSEGLPLLRALIIVVRSKYNCRIFGYHGGIQKLIGLLKASVLQLKTIAGALSVDGGGPPMVIKERYGALRETLVYVLSIICCFIELNSNACEVAQLYSDTSICNSKNEMSVMDPKSSLKNNLSDTLLLWRLKAVISVMEAGGLNWLVELLRVIRRLNIREQRKQIPLQYLIMRALYSAISENTRAQNHLRSIGGLEVLLDGLELPCSYISSQNSSISLEFMNPNIFFGALEVHHLSLEVLRESVFGNLSNLQFLSENGRVHKFANRICAPAFLLQEYVTIKRVVVWDDAQIAASSSGCYNDTKTCNTETGENYLAGAAFLEYWKNYVAKLSQALCSFILSSEEAGSAYLVGAAGRNVSPVSTAFADLSVKWTLKVLFVIFTCIKAFLSEDDLPAYLRIFVYALQRHVLDAFKNVLASSPFLLEVFRGEGIWQLVFSDRFFFFEPALGTLPDITTSQLEAILFVEYVATSTGSTHNLPECSALLDALEKSVFNPEVAIVLAKSMIEIFKQSPEKTVASFTELKAVSRVLKVACIQADEFRGNGSINSSTLIEVKKSKLNRFETSRRWRESVEASVHLFAIYLSAADDAKNVVLHCSTCIDCLFHLFWEEYLRNLMLGYIFDLMKTTPTSVEDKAKKHLCSKFFETFNLVKEKAEDYVDISIDLLAGMREMLVMEQARYQAIFRDGECFLHVVSLLNGTPDTSNGEKLVLSVLETLTCLLANNDASKATFRSLVGRGYQTIQSLLLNYCRGEPTEQVLNALLEMLVDAKFDLLAGPLIKNEDAIILYLKVLQKSNDSLRQHGLNIFLQLLRDSISNRDSCVRAGMMNFLLDWFSQEDNDNVILKISQLIQVTGGHSISGKDIRRIFALLRSEKVGSRQQYCSLLMNSILSMLNEKGPTAFFDLIGNNSGIIIKKPIQWPINRGFTFSCWLRVETFPRYGTMGLFSFLSEHGRGCIALIAQDKLIFKSISQKRVTVSLNLNIVRKKWHFLCITHSIGGRFSGGSLLRCFVDGQLLASEKCSYARVSEPLTNCTIGTQILLPQSDEENISFSAKDVSPFQGQIGPVYVFNDAISAGQVLGINSLGPSYMYSFLDTEAPDDPSPGGVFDAKDGLAPKVVFGLNAQASSGRRLYNASSLMEHAPDKSEFEATVMSGTQLCSRRLLQQIIYCVGGVSVFFPLFTQSHWYENSEERDDQTLLIPITKERLTAEVIELIASVLDENLANQQQMHLVSGFSILGYLLQSVPPQQLNLETLSALKHLFNVVASCGLSDLLVKDAISYVFLNPLVWIYTAYKVQRELYMFVIQQFDNDPRLLQSLCRLPRVIDIIRHYYWNSVKSRSSSGGKPLLHPVTKEVIGERPSREEINKLRLLLLSLGEMSLRQSIAQSDVKSLVAFCETSQDMACVEDVLCMVVRALTLKPLLASFVEQVQLIGGCQVFLNLLQREYEPVRLLGLLLVGRLLVVIPAEKKGLKFFSLAAGKCRPLTENVRKANIGEQQPIFSAMADRLFRFPLTEHMRSALFDVLLDGASPPIQVLQQQDQLERLKNRSGCHFFLPQILPLIFKFLSQCKNSKERVKIMASLVELLESNPSNIEAIMEHGWNAWLMASAELEVVKYYKMSPYVQDDNVITEQNLVRALYIVVLSHYICSIKGGWQYLEETANFILVNFEQGGVSYHYLLRDIYEDLIRRLLEFSSEDNILGSQPCRDNTLYLLRLIDELLLSEIDHKLPFPARSSELPSDIIGMDSEDLGSALYEALQGESDERISSNLPKYEPSLTGEDVIMDEEWWNLYDYLWIILSEMNGKGTSRALPKSSSAGPSLGQRARGLVESLNIPAAEMAAVVVSGGLGNALGGKSSKNIDKAMLLRGEKCPRIVFRLVVLYLCRASLQRASRCVEQIIPLLPCLLIGDDEQSKNRLQLFIWSLLVVRSEYGMLDDGTRFHVISHLIREIVSYGKFMLATSIAGRDDSSDTGGHIKEPAAIHNLLQKDKIISAVLEESNFMKTLKSDRTKLLTDIHVRIHEGFSAEAIHNRDFEDELRDILNVILSSDDSRRSAFQLACDEEQQIVTAKWLHVFRSTIDERGPWSANTFPNCAVRHWKLDKAEDSWRRRLKLKQNYHFDEKLCQPPANASDKEYVEPASENKSGSGVPIPEQMKRFLLKGIRRITDEGMLEFGDGDPESSEDNISKPEQVSDSQSEGLKEGVHLKDSIQEMKETSSPSLEAESGEVLLSAVCVLITPKRKLAGRLTVRRNALHFSGEFLVEGTAGSSVFRNFDSLSTSESVKLDNSTGMQKEKFVKLQIHSTSDSEKPNNVDSVFKQSTKIKRHRRWDLSKIKAVHWTRYLLRYTAVEIFFSNSVAPVFLNFASQQLSKDIGTLIVTTRNELLYPKGSNRSGVIPFIDRRVAQELAETARESWRRREMTNFEYIMILNTLAGRSYSDLMQYPVFPWVLADYSSEMLDFNKSSTFRDLSKPVGALDAKRFEVFEDRYQNFDDPDIPSFYYGSHYSSAGIVLYYLLRLEPFTYLHRNLQGGKFDHADRLFQSIEGTYKNCLTNTSDVKELIPEFFYMPEFLVNSNSYHLGVRQDGDPIDNVCLPPWAKGSPEEFICKNREALESEYVSSNLHNWIDLVFGYKQRGKPAVEAANVFYYVTYEGAVDLENMEDELQRSAIEDQIANFGQTPIQIFRKKHPRRGPPVPIAHPLHFAPDHINLTSLVPGTSQPSSALLYVNIFDSNVVLVNQGLTMAVKLWVTTQLQSGGNFTFSGSQDPFFGIGYDILSSRKIGSPLAENAELGSQCFATLQTPSENFLILCGNWEYSFQVISLVDGRCVQGVRRHKDVVSAVAVSTDGGILATGSYDTTVMVWEVQHGKMHEKRVRSAQSELARKACIISETPFHVLCGHDDIITCLYVSVDLDIVISGSKDGTCMFHTLREGKYVRSLRHPSGSPLSKFVVSRHGRIVLYSDDDLSLHLYTINGKHIASSESNGRLNCVQLSTCGNFLVYGGDQGFIVVRSMNSLDMVMKYNSAPGKVITSLAVTPEECFLAGTKDGNLLVYSIENKRSKSKSSLTG